MAISRRNLLCKGQGCFGDGRFQSRKGRIWLRVIRAGPIRSENNLVLSAVFRLCRIMPGEDQGWKSWSDAVEFFWE